MADWLTAIEQLGAVRALKGSFYAYPIINALHVLAVGVLLTTVLLMDLRVVGLIRSLPEAAFVRLLRRYALGAFGIAVLTGATMFSVRAVDYAAMPLFLAKMALIGLAGINFVAFSVLDKRRGQGRPSGAVGVLAILSVLIWLAVLLAGRFLGFV